MNTERHHSGHDAGKPVDLGPRHEDVSFETRDVQAKTIYWYLAILAIAVAASFAASIWVLHTTTRIAEQGDTPPPPSRAMLGGEDNKVPEPRLQGVPGHESDPQQDMRDKLKADSEANEVTAWVDRGAGIAQIPVKEAMKIIAEKGLPATSGAAGAKSAEKK